MPPLCQSINSRILFCRGVLFAVSLPIVMSGLGSPLHNLCQSKMAPDISIIALPNTVVPEISFAASKYFVWNQGTLSDLIFEPKMRFVCCFLRFLSNISDFHSKRGYERQILSSDLGWGVGATHFIHLPAYFWGVAKKIQLHLMKLKHIQRNNYSSPLLIGEVTHL